MKRSKPAITIVLAIVFSFTSVFGAVGAETASKGTTLIDIALEAEPEESDVQEETEDSSEMVEGKQEEEEEEPVSENQGEENRIEDVPEESTEPVIEDSNQDKKTEHIEIDEAELIEEDGVPEADNVTDAMIAQAIWTKDNSTLTFFYGVQVSVGEVFNEAIVTNVWGGTDVTSTGDSLPKWSYSSANKVIFDETFISVRPTSTYGWFYSFNQLREIDFSGLNTSNVTNMSNMFYQCNHSYFTQLDLSGFDTSSVTDMSDMFYECLNLTDLDLSGFDTSSVTDMSNMFNACRSLTNLDLSNFDTSNVTNMVGMFQKCSAITSINVGSFDTSEVTDMGYMFDNCLKLQDLDVSGFDTSNVIDMSHMFSFCYQIRQLDVSDFDTSSVTSMNSMFCSNVITELDVSGFDTSNVTDMAGMFHCINLTSLDVSGFDTSNVTSMGGMFYDCINLASIDVSGFDTSKVTSMGSMFANCNHLSNVDVGGFDTSNVTSMHRMFSACQSLTTIELSNFNTSQVTDMSGMFYICSRLTDLDVSGFDTSSVTDMSEMFTDCKNLIDLDVSGFDTSNVSSFEYMFDGCNKLTCLDISGFDVSKATNQSALRGMFQNCAKLTTIYCENSTTDWSDISAGPIMFYHCNALIGTDEGTQIVYDNSKTNSTMAKSASLGGYFTPKPNLFVPVEPGFISKEFNYRTELLNKDEKRIADSIIYKFDYSDYWAFSENLQDCYSLMKTSIRVAMAASGAKEDNWYGPVNIKQMMRNMGFDYTVSSVVYPEPTKQNENTVGSAIGLKNLIMPDGTIRSIILVAIRGGGYGTEWGGNFHVGSNGKDSTGFRLAADQVNNRLKEFIDNNRSYISDNLRIWITGFSRAGATCNLVASDLINGSFSIQGVTPDEVWAFCFECPKTTTDFNANDSKYDNIISIVNPNDFVPKVPLKAWGFRRYGRTFYIPCAEIASDYENAYRLPMAVKYLDIFNYNDIPLVSDAVSEVAGQASLLDSFMDHLGFFILRKDYNQFYEDAIVDIATSKLGNAGEPDWLTAAPSIMEVLRVAFLRPFTTDAVLMLFMNGDPGSGPNAHYPELCLSWIDSLSSFENYYTEKFGFYRKVIINCAVDITVRDSTGSIVGQIENDEARSIEGGIVTRVDEDGQKTFILPQDEEYTISITAIEDGEVNCTVKEYNFDSNTTERIINYKRIRVNDGDELLGTASKGFEAEQAEYTLQYAEDDILIEPDEILVEEEVPEYSVKIKSNENGTAIGGGLYVKGEFAKVTATANEGYRFDGWYSGDECISREAEYRFAVETDTTLTAVFLQDKTLSIENTTILGIENKIYTGYEIYQDITLKCNETILFVDNDYTVSYENNINVGTATITITGLGSYTGTIEKTFSITPKTISPVVELSKTSFVYNGKEQKPAVSVKDGETEIPSSAYTVEWPSECVNVGIYQIGVTLSGNYSGSNTADFRIIARDNSPVIELTNDLFIYNGKEQKPEVSVKIDGKILAASNYEISWSAGCTNPGIYSIKVVLKGNYSGTASKVFTILPSKTTRGDMFNLANNVKVTWKEVPGAKYYKVYREGITDPKESQKEPVIVTERLIGWDKQPGLTNGHAYRYKIVASLTGKGDSSGDSTLSYSKLMYRLKTVVIRSVRNTAPGKVTVKYDKTTSGDSYVLQYCERQDMVGAKTKVVLGANNTSYTIGGLKKGKTYYISIRVRKKVNGIDYYTTFGVPKKIKITK